jgi:hypothetical protein
MKLFAYKTVEVNQSVPTSDTIFMQTSTKISYSIYLLQNNHRDNYES